jgi:hypothetical protein
MSNEETKMPAWIKADDRTYLATAEKPNGTCHHLAVMQSVDRRWEWITWREGTPRDQGYYGHSYTVLDAMKAAEHAIAPAVQKRSNTTPSHDAADWRREPVLAID